MKKLSKNSIIGLVVGLVLVLTIGIGYGVQNNKQKSKEYEASFNVALTVMNQDVQLVNEICKTYNMLYTNYSSNFLYNGTFVDYIKREAPYGTYQELAKAQDTLKERKYKQDELMKELENHPKQFTEKYNKLEELYTIYTKMYNKSKEFDNYSVQVVNDFIDYVDAYTNGVKEMNTLLEL